MKLEQNYRSRTNILRSANALIANNPHMFEKRLWSERGPGEEVRIVEVEDEVAEVDRIAGEIVAHQSRHRGAFGDYAVIYRSNHQVRELELRLQALRVPYRVSGGSSFFDRGEIRDVIAYFRLLVNPDDDGAFLRVVNVPRRQIGTATLAALQRRRTARRSALLAAVGDSALDAEAGSGADRLRAFARHARRLSRAHEAARRRPAGAVRSLLDECDYAAISIARTAIGTAKSTRVRSRFENVEILLRAITRAHGRGRFAGGSPAQPRPRGPLGRGRADAGTGAAPHAARVQGPGVPARLDHGRGGGRAAASQQHLRRADRARNGASPTWASRAPWNR